MGWLVGGAAGANAKGSLFFGCGAVVGDVVWGGVSAVSTYSCSAWFASKGEGC